MPRPNILYLHSHDTGRYIQPYGYPTPTPQLQRLARWMERTDDPLLPSELVPAPPGAEVNNPQGLSPREPTLRIP